MGLTVMAHLLWVYFGEHQVCHANAGTWDLVNGGPATVLPSLIDGPCNPSERRQ